VKYLLMHKTNPVLRMELDETTGMIASVDEAFARERVPVGVGEKDGTANRVELNDWWTGRSIPASRSGLRDALEVMKVSSPRILLAKCYGLSLSDQYWSKPENSDLLWENVNSDILSDSPFIDDARRNALYFGLSKRVEMLRDYAEARQRSENRLER
jgi:hypothetical protein